jgi:hypothetical protein
MHFTKTGRLLRQLCADMAQLSKQHQELGQQCRELVARDVGLQILTGLNETNLRLDVLKNYFVFKELYPDWTNLSTSLGEPVKKIFGQNAREISEIYQTTDQYRAVTALFAHELGFIAERLCLNGRRLQVHELKTLWFGSIQMNGSHVQWQYTGLINFIWRHEGTTTELLEWCAKMERLTNVWQIMPSYSWLIYISALLETGNQAKAEQLLLKYQTQHGNFEIDRYLPVARLAWQLGCKDENIRRAALIFERMEQHRHARVFEQILANHSIAVVGNGPSEIGKGLGGEIDAHDVVIRINNYRTGNFADDYGSKTNVWVRGSGGPDILPRNISQFKCVMWEADYWHFPAHYDFLEVAWDWFQHYDVPVTYFDFETHTSLRKAADLLFPSTGLMAAWSARQTNGGKNQLSIYGFSFRQKEISHQIQHYFNQTRSEEELARGAVHDFKKEADFMSRIFADKNLI